MSMDAKLGTLGREWTYVVWSLDAEARMCPRGCQARFQTMLSWAVSTLATSFSFLVRTEGRESTSITQQVITKEKIKCYSHFI